MNSHALKVAMCFPYELKGEGGAELATYSLAHELNLKKMCHTRICVFKKNNIFPNKISSQKSTAFEVPIYRYPCANLPFFKTISVQLMANLRNSDDDILHFQGAPRIWNRLLLEKTVRNKAKILTTHGLQESKFKLMKNISSELIKPFFAESFMSLDHIIALCKNDEKILLSLGYEKRRITIIPNGIDETKFTTRRSFVKKNNKKKILCVARFDETKNYELLVNVLQKLSKEMNVEAYFVGGLFDYKYFKKIYALIKENHLESNITLAPSLDNAALVDCYLSCDLFVLPSTVETSPLVILEAMYAGLPILAANVGGIPELVKERTNGFTFSPYDFDQPLELSKLLLKDEVLMHDIGARNKEYARNYTWTKVASLTRDLYSKVIKEQRRF